MQLDRPRDGRRRTPSILGLRPPCTRLLSLLAVLAASLASSTPARAAIKAPGLQQGPTILREGLLWSSAAGVSLSRGAETRLLVPDLQLAQVLVRDGWTVAANQIELTAGKSGGRLSPIPALQLCDPIPSQEGSWLDALSGGDLFVIVQGACLSDRPIAEQVLARIRLSDGRAERIAPVRAGAASLVAAGDRLAVTYLTQEKSGARRGPGRVDVLDSRSLRRLYSLSAPPVARATPSAMRSKESTGQPSMMRAPVRKRSRFPYSRTQVDAEGDVLVTSATRGYALDSTAVDSTAFGWWGNARMRVGRALLEPAGGTLSARRIAYVASRGGVQHIDVLDLATDATRTEVELRGSVRVIGVDLRVRRLAWAQQSYGYMARGSCVESGPLGDPELAESRLSASGPPIVVNAPSATRPPGRTCHFVAYG